MSIALVKKRAPLTLNGASKAAIWRAGEVAGEDDAVVDVDPVEVDAGLEGRRRVPHEADARGAPTPRARGRGRRARAAAGLTGNVPTRKARGASHRQEVRAVVEKKDWPSEGARKPVLTAPRTTKEWTGW